MCIDCNRPRHRKKRGRKTRQNEKAECVLVEIYNSVDKEVAGHRWYIKSRNTWMVQQTWFETRTAARNSAIAWADRNMPFLKLHFTDKEISNPEILS